MNRVRWEEALEDARAQLGRNSVAAALHAQLDGVAVYLEMDRGRSSRLRASHIKA